MKQRAIILNNFSLVFFILSSLSLLGVPFLDMAFDFPAVGYMLAGIFWGGLMLGIIFQIIAAVCSKKGKTNQEKHKGPGILLICSLLFFLVLVFILSFEKKSVMLMSADLACMLFSIEMFFYMKRRYNI